MSKSLLCAPTVCAVGENYQILVPTTCDLLVRCVVDEHEFFDHVNGVQKYTGRVRKFTVPMALLDRARGYTLLCREMLLPLPYRPVVGETETLDFPFRPLEKTENIHLCQIADSHGAVDEAIKVGLFGDKLDLLLLNGDIASASSTEKELLMTYRISGSITKGEIPCVIVRGNHDLRGILAQRLDEYMPCDNGRSYYSFRLGCIAGLALDCGEDKADDHPEYGGTICCHAFRAEETAFLQKAAKATGREDGILYRLVVAHHPFPYVIEPPFDIEQDTYAAWCKILREDYHPDLLLSGHLHCLAISEPGGAYDSLGQPCTVLIGSDHQRNADKTAVCYTGIHVSLAKGTAKVQFVDSANGLREEHTVRLPG